jgi:hypothetical protein
LETIGSSSTLWYLFDAPVASWSKPRKNHNKGVFVVVVVVVL